MRRSYGYIRRLIREQINGLRGAIACVENRGQHRANAFGSDKPGLFGSAEEP